MLLLHGTRGAPADRSSDRPQQSSPLTEASVAQGATVAQGAAVAAALVACVALYYVGMSAFDCLNYSSRSCTSVFDSSLCCSKISYSFASSSFTVMSSNFCSNSYFSLRA